MGAVFLTWYRNLFWTLLLAGIWCGGLTSGLLASNVYNETTTTWLSVKDGLSGNSVTAVLQDSKGYIWVGTQDGLNCYDGYSFEVFRHEIGDDFSISGNHIKCIAEDLNGDLWIGTIGDGLNKWDRKTGRFSSYSTKSTKVLTLPEDNILGLSFDIDSTLWVKTDNYLLNIDIKERSVNKYGLYSNIFHNNEYSTASLLHKSISYLWIGTNEGISQFNKAERLYERIETKGNNISGVRAIGQITTMLPLSEGTIMVGGTKGLGVLRETGQGSYSFSEIDLGSKVPVGINAAIAHSQGGVFVGSSLGLMLLTYDYVENKLVFELGSNENVLVNKEVTSIIEDGSGLLWVGTKYDGIIKVDFKPRRFKLLEGKLGELQDLLECDVRSIHIDESGKIWIGTFDKGIKIVDPESSDVYNFPVNYSLYRSQKDKVLCMCQDSKKRLWIGTGNGVYIYYKERGVISEFSYADNAEFKSLLQQNEINAIEEDLKGNIWLATRFGLYRYDGYQIESYFSDGKDETSICDDEVHALFQDSEGVLWIGTKRGINFIDRKQDADIGFGHLKNFNDSTSLLSNDHILSIAEDNNNRMWFGSRSGVTFYDKTKDGFGYYSHLEGVANDMINSIVCDKQSRIWLCTNKGVSLIDENGAVFNFDLKDGLPGYVYNKNATAVDANGNIYFGGVGGVAYLNPDSIVFNRHKPKVLITSMELYHKGKLIQRFRGDEKNISLKYRKSLNLKVKYAALEYTEPLENKFQVYLEGFDDDWREITTENEVNFSDLPAGEYVLHVKGSNSDFVWTQDPIYIPIKIIPPIWMSNYAYAFYFIALVFLIQSIINYRIRHYKNEYKSLQEKAVDKKKLEAQKEMLSKINQSLTDSIYYAKRIQESILPDEKKIKSALPDSFVYYRPKDLVSGDFYWLHESDDKLFVAAVDCTGHGVPGAFMSIIAYDMLKGIITSSEISCPAKILDKLSKEVIATFKKDNKDLSERKQAVNDSMDIALCVIDKAQRKLTFAGAYNPLYLVRNNEIFVYKGDRFAIGYLSEEEPHYSKHEIQIEPNDTFYIFSDGYVDQFGGDDGKKFKYRRFRHLLLNIHKLPADDQKAIIHQKFEEWKGDHEQVDDIIVMGIKPIVELV